MYLSTEHKGGYLIETEVSDTGDVDVYIVPP